jgi:hypothetical protein
VRINAYLTAWTVEPFSQRQRPPAGRRSPQKGSHIQLKHPSKPGRVTVPHQPPNWAIPSIRMKALLNLCHPDKHPGSRIAHETTQWLLAQRKAA